MRKAWIFIVFLMFWATNAWASHYDLVETDLLSAELTSRLIANNIHNTETLLKQLITKSDREAFSKQYAQELKDVEALARKIELMQITGVGPKAATLLRLAGVQSLAQLAQSKPEPLLEALLKANREHKITGVQPDLIVVNDWIEQGKQISLQLK